MLLPKAITALCNVPLGCMFVTFGFDVVLCTLSEYVDVRSAITLRAPEAASTLLVRAENLGMVTEDAGVNTLVSHLSVICCWSPALHRVSVLVLC